VVATMRTLRTFADIWRRSMIPDAAADLIVLQMPSERFQKERPGRLNTGR
jgi:hypothetical protein